VCFMHIVCAHRRPTSERAPVDDTRCTSTPTKMILLGAEVVNANDNADCARQRNCGPGRPKLETSTCVGFIVRRELPRQRNARRLANLSGELEAQIRIGVPSDARNHKNSQASCSCKRITQAPPQHARTQQVAMFAAGQRLGKKVLTVSCRPDCGKTLRFPDSLWIFRRTHASTHPCTVKCTNRVERMIRQSIPWNRLA
jgi:hypothetical protein